MGSTATITEWIEWFGTIGWYNYVFMSIGGIALVLVFISISRLLEAFRSEQEVENLVLGDFEDLFDEEEKKPVFQDRKVDF